MGIVLPNGKQSFEDAIGTPLVGGKVYTYAANTNTPKITWSDAGETAPNTNPVILDARGEATIFWDGAYKVALHDSLDNVIWTVDNITTIDADFEAFKDALAADGGASLVGSTDGNTVQDDLDRLTDFDTSLGDDGGAALIGVSGGGTVQSALDRLGSPTPSRIRQLLYTNLYLMNNVGGGINNLGDSISHGAYCGNCYTNHWMMLLARSIGAEFDTRSIGYIPMEGIYNPQPELVTKQIHDVVFSAGWGALSTNPAPYNYPQGNFGPSTGGIGLGGENIVNGKSYSSSTSGSTITITTVALTETMAILVTRQPGGGVINVTVNGIAAGSINTAGTLLYNDEHIFSVSDNGSGACVIVLTKADASPTEINSVIGYFSDDNVINDLSARLRVNNFSMTGRTLSDMSEDNIIRACNAPALIMSLGYNDWVGYNTDTDDTAFAKFKQKIDFFIQYQKVFRTLTVVQDFIWYAAEGSRTRGELARLASETNGIYIPYADQFFSDGIPPTISPLQLNNPLFLWADQAHPNYMGNELIFSTLASAMELAVRSKRNALEYHDWAFPIPITNANFTNNTPSFVRSISTITQEGRAYRIKTNLKYSAGAIPVGLYTVSAGAAAKYRDGAVLGFGTEFTSLGTFASDVLFTQNDAVIGVNSGSGGLTVIQATRVVEGNV